MNELYALIDMLVDDKRWPTYTDSTVLGRLSLHASEAFERDTSDGYLS